MQSGSGSVSDMRIHQFIPYLHGPGDAAADLIYAFQQAFRAWGHDSRVFALEADAGIEDRWLPVEAYLSESDARDIFLYHYVVGSPLVARLLESPARLMLYYHNITPARYIAPFHPNLAASLRAGREAIRELRAVPALTPSKYNRQELLQMGFRDVRVVPLLVDFERLQASAQTPTGQALIQRFADGTVNWVTVGRIAPNKRCEDVLKAFAYYQRMIHAEARLFFVGGSRHFEAYHFNLVRLAEHLGIEDKVHWCGWVPYEEGFGAYYQIASVFVYMSEHEGFCVPLVEAMYFEVPIVAYAAAAIPDTLGSAGVLVKHKQHEMIAGMVNRLQEDRALRESLRLNQRERLADFSAEMILRRLASALDLQEGVRSDR